MLVLRGFSGSAEEATLGFEVVVEVVSERPQR